MLTWFKARGDLKEILSSAGPHTSFFKFFVSWHALARTKCPLQKWWQQYSRKQMSEYYELSSYHWLVLYPTLRELHQVLPTEHWQSWTKAQVILRSKLSEPAIKHIEVKLDLATATETYPRSNFTEAKEHCCHFWLIQLQSYRYHIGINTLNIQWHIFWLYLNSLGFKQVKNSTPKPWQNSTTFSSSFLQNKMLLQVKVIVNTFQYKALQMFFDYVLMH